ncbi:quinone oxidoreductase family protein [Nocardia stercoris]|uniref:Dehydrogenase n=1 Tax=Nocardia stercoris TaxID=2483361 RepID=A0A3M2KZ27_9NOCA|nr:zinc-binding dehydrogenase [Nocardia stercoris]RMI30712.1 dehydrogenase [Nocardia stercoris]
MQAIVMTTAGAPDVLQAREVDRPAPGPGEISVRTTAIPVLFGETLLRSGAFPTWVPLPAIFGLQAIGVVEAVGPSTDTGLLGRRVVVSTAGSGAYAEFVCVPAAVAAHIPDELTDEDAAAVSMSGSVATQLIDTAGLRAGETILVQAGATGVGAYLIQLARAAGAGRIIATAGGPAKLARARAFGADDVVDHNDPGWPEAVGRTLGRSTLDVVFDAFGGDPTRQLLDYTTPERGRVLSYGQLSGEPASVAPEDLSEHKITLTHCGGPDWLARVAPRRATAMTAAVAGTLTPLVDRILPLAEAARAHRLVEERATTGTIILRP